MKHTVGILKNYMKSMKHIKGKKKLEANVAQERSIVEALRMHNEKHHLRGETLPDSQYVHLIKWSHVS